MKPVLALGAAMLALWAGLAWYLAPLEPGILRLQFAATPRAFGAVVHAWGSEGLARYRAHFAADTLLLLVYATFGWLAVRRTPWFATLGPRVRAAAAWLLPTAALCDAAENALHLWLTEVPRFGLAPLYAASTALSAVKWVMIVAFLAVTAWALARREAR